jgi:hypothetical protein
VTGALAPTQERIPSGHHSSSTCCKPPFPRRHGRPEGGSKQVQARGSPRRPS